MQRWQDELSDELPSYHHQKAFQTTGLISYSSRPAALSSTTEGTFPPTGVVSCARTSVWAADATLVREPITVDSGTTVQLDFDMAVGDSASQGAITADMPVIQTGPSTIQYGIDLKQIDEYPIREPKRLTDPDDCPGPILFAVGVSPAVILLSTATASSPILYVFPRA